LIHLDNYYLLLSFKDFYPPVCIFVCLIGFLFYARASAQRLINEHGLDEAGRGGLRTLVGAVERSWYAGALGSVGGPHRGEYQPSNPPDDELRSAMEAVLACMASSAPLTRRARLLPRSVLPRHRTR